jgi:hypothetical protein
MLLDFLMGYGFSRNESLKGKVLFLGASPR